MLLEFVTLNRDEIIRRCRRKVATRSIPAPTDAEINHGVPLFLDQLSDALRPGPPSNAAITTSAGLHGHDLRQQGFTVSQVVHDYGDICQAITELAVETDAPITVEDFRTLNKCLDDAIAGAVTQFAREGNQSAIDTETVRGTERLGFFAHELRNLLNTALLAFDVLKSGHVGVSGSTGTVLPREAVDDLFRPFQQRGADRTGLGLGLPFSRWGAEANHGRVYARNLPGTGCVFTVDLPRVLLPAVASTH